MTMKRFGIAGWSGSGKTTLVRRLLPELIGRGLAVSTVKHAHHDFDVDSPGKDSYEHRAAGANEVMVASSVRWALMHEGRGEAEPRLDDLVARMAPVDLILIEGFKSEDYEKLEVHRPSLGKALLCRDDAAVVALASDGPVEGIGLRVLALDDVAAIADFIIAHCGLDAARGAA
jgi:molybdopterin-guanine dinucleotide biosynthesis protein B